MRALYLSVHFLLFNTHSFDLNEQASLPLLGSVSLKCFLLFTFDFFFLSTIYPGCSVTCVLPDRAVRVYYVSVSPRRLQFQIAFR